jgi:polar amino acid transport system substrate-binding protein
MGIPDRYRRSASVDLSGNTQRGGNQAPDTGQLRSSPVSQTLSLLPGRQRFRDRLKKHLRAASADNKSLALVVLALNPYKRISRIVGPAGADRLIRRAADRVAAILGDQGDFEYWGGDEFAILLSNIEGVSEVATAVQTIQEKLERRVLSQKHEFYLTSNAGIAVYPTHGVTVETLMRNAAAALSGAKSAGGRTRCFYSQEMNARELRILNLENQLLRALRRDEFTIHYQPLVDTKTWRLIGAEALIRWEHPELGIIPPAEFVPLAEENGLIAPIGEWVLFTACSQLKYWHGAGFRDLHLSVNVSAKQFRELDPSNTVFRILKESSIDPGCLALELTESSIMSDDRQVLGSLNQLKAMGVKLSIDDFGMGFSSLDHLRCLPIDTIKIDKSFVRNASVRAGDAALVSSIITLAHRLNLTVIGEGVETMEQLRFLTCLGCDAVQGYFFSKPLPLDKFQAFLTSQS